MRARVGPRVDRLLDYREYPVLFVDDEVENLRVFELGFRREFQVRTARSGEEALQSLHEHPSAIVLSDHRMEGMSGVELLAKVREVDAKTIRILVTAFGDAATLSDAINNGWIYRYVAKPWRPEEMRLTLRTAIEVYALAREREELLYELDALNAAAKTLNRELELVPLLDRVLETLTHEFGFDGATVFLFDATGERLQAVRSAPAGGGVAQRPVEFDISAGAAPRFIEALREGRMRRVRMEELLSLEAPVRRFATEVAADEIMLLPLLGHAGVIGALAVDNRRGGEGFGAADYTLLDGLASQAVIAIENARLVEDLRRSREHVRRVDRLGTLGTLAAGLAHEINNPLVAIRTFLSLAPAKRREEDRDFWTSYHELALREVDRIHGLVKTMARLGHGADEESPRGACDLAELVREAVTLLAPEAMRAGVDVAVELADDVPKVVGVRDHLHQVVLNLLLNAIQATARPPRTNGGSPAAPGRVRVVLRPGAPEAESVCLEVGDDGCGIASDDLERIFDPFFTTKGPEVGSGLGLMICHRIVQDHGGSIEVESLEGRGATFRVHLPVCGGA
jgi:signal transduction histidine kinase/DNA-binding response OmpR family regulator